MFQYLDGAVYEGEATSPIMPDETKFQDEGEWSDAVALGVVLADVDTAIQYEQAKNFVTNMEAADDLIRGYVRVRPWP